MLELSPGQTIGRGFKAHWEIGCGGTYTEPGVIMSPYFPDTYPTEKARAFHLTAGQIAFGPKIFLHYMQPFEKLFKNLGPSALPD